MKPLFYLDNPTDYALIREETGGFELEYSTGGNITRPHRESFATFQDAARRAIEILFPNVSIAA